MSDPKLFSNLLPVSWRDLSFPVSHISTQLSHDIARHKRADRDGARLESTGRNPYLFTCKALFLNNLTPGPKEYWKQPLFPNVYLLVMSAMADRSTDVFQHPVLGKVKCKAVSAHDDITATTRDGIHVDLTFEETIEVEDDLRDIFGQAAPLNDAQSAALDLDSSLTQFKTIKAADPEKKLSFSDAVAAIKSAYDKFTLINMQVGGMIGRVLYRIQVVQNAVNSAKDVQMWPVTQSLERLRAALYQQKKQALASQKSVSIYVTPRQMTVGAVANFLNNSVQDIIKLNPSTAGGPSLAPRTVVRYYKAA